MLLRFAFLALGLLGTTFWVISNWHKILIDNEIFSKDLRPLLTPNLRCQSRLLDIEIKVLWFQKVCAKSVQKKIHRFRYIWNRIFLGTDHQGNPWRDHLAKTWRVNIVEKPNVRNFSLSISCFLDAWGWQIYLFGL